MACVHIDIEDYLDDARPEDIEREYLRRLARGYVPKHTTDSEPWIRDGLAADIRNAYYARNASQLEALLVVLERHEETV